MAEGFVNREQQCALPSRVGGGAGVGCWCTRCVCCLSSWSHVCAPACHCSQVHDESHALARVSRPKVGLNPCTAIKTSKPEGNPFTYGKKDAQVGVACAPTPSAE